MKYIAFISYRHGGLDEKVGIRIQREIESYRLPVRIAKEYGGKTLGKVFRDADDLRAASNLSEIIRQGLDESQYLIVVCTKRYQESVWCMEEIEYFIQIRGRENIIVVLVEGEPEESFPKILTEIEQDGKIVKIEPLAVDVRAASERETLRLVSREKLRFISQMLNLDYDDLKQRQKERQRRNIIALGALIIVCLGIFGGVVTMKNFQLNAAYDQLDASMQQTLRGQSYYLSEYANEAYLNGDRATAALLSLMALPEDLSNPDRPYVPDVMRSLTDALGIYDFSSGYQGDTVYEFEEESYDTKVEISSDKKLLLIEKYQTAAANMLQGEVELYQIEDRKLLGSYPLAEINRANSHKDSRCSRLMEDGKTLLYLGEDGLRAVDVYTGEERFTGETGSQLVLSEKNDVIAVYDINAGMLYYYDADGKKRAETVLGTQGKFNLYCISPDSTIAVLSQDSDDGVGILLTDTSNGMMGFMDKTESCSQIAFINDHSICFIRQDTQVGRSHIVVTDLNENADDYLVDTDRSIDGFAVSGHESFFFFQGSELFEISNKSGKVVWQNAYLSEVASVKTQGETLAVTLQNGQSYFYHVETHELINSVTGNGQTFYMLALSEDYACMGNYWGQNIRLYTRREMDREDVKSVDISAVNASAPENWYTAISDGRTVFLDFQNGMEDRVQVLSADNLDLLASTTLKEMDYESFQNLSVEAVGDYICVQDYAYGENAHFNASTMEKYFTFDEDSYYFYSQDKSLLTIAEGEELVLYRAADGTEQERASLRSGYDRGILAGKWQIFGNDSSICLIQEGKEDVILEDAVIYTFDTERGNLYYRNEKGDHWFVYSMEAGEVVCEGEAGTFSGTILFDDGRYFLNDYSEVYNTDTWEKVLDLSEISTGVYGVSTTEEIPYFVVWYQSGDVEASGKATGTNAAYLYRKDGSNTIVGVVPNYVATATDGSVIVFDGEHTLYQVPLYSDSELLEMAKNYVEGMSLTDSQKERYHIYAE